MAKKKNPGGGEMTFFQHLDALRPHLVRGVSVLLAVTTLSFFLPKDFIIDHVLLGPSDPGFVTNRLLAALGEWSGVDGLALNTSMVDLVNTRMAGQFNLHMTVALVAGVAITVPYLLWELWRFIRPALSDFERRQSNLFVLYVSFCFFTGMAFGYFIIAPVTVGFLTGYEASGNITNMIDVTSYLTTVMTVTLACALLFQLPVLVYFLARTGIMGADFLKKYRKHAYVVLVVCSAIFTPPDLLSLFLVAIPLIFLYEFSIKIAVRIEKKKQRAALEDAGG